MFNTIFEFIGIAVVALFISYCLAIAIEKIIEVCGEESDSIAFRSSFYTLVLKGVIERPILEVLSYGPKTNRDLEFLSKRKEMENIVEYARVALSMIS